MKYFTRAITALTIMGAGVLSLQPGSAQGVEPLDLPDGSEFSVADIFWPSMHLTMAGGGSSEEPGELQLGGHDPRRDGFTLQGLELDMSLRANEYIEGFVAWNLSWGGEEEEWVDEFEEAFGKLTSLPGGFEVRGGRMLNRFGLRNAQHLHSWNTIDQSLVNARFLGEEGLSHEGGDVTWYLPTPFTTALTVSYGEARAHDHSHGGGHGHEEAHEEEEHEEEEHGEEHGEEHDDHGSHSEDAEEISFEDDVFSANLVVKANRDDFNQFTFGGSIASGDNGLEEDTLISGLNLSYVWRENGLESGGKQLTWNTELMLRDFDAAADHAHEEHGEDDHDEEYGEEADHEEHGEEDEFTGDDEFGFYSEVIYGPNEAVDVGLRLGYVAGIDEIGLDERFRISPVATFHLSQQRNLHLRLQYNYDDVESGPDAHSAWAQLQYSFGGKEVR